VDPAAHDADAVGDEALLLARAAPTWVARDRVAGARAAAGAGSDVVVMDDGFQNPHLAKNLSILAVDGAVGFGTGRPMPAGPLREPLARGLRRAQAAVIVGTDRTEAALLIAHTAPGLPILNARLVPQGIDDLAGARVLAFAGIGRPEKVFETVRETGADLIEAHAFPDHHPYAPREAAWLVKRARELRARPVTTEKDLVRLPASIRGEVRALAVSLVFESRDETALDRLLAKTLAVARQAGGAGGSDA
jgi:tetraacyldisaccharide 4'-kinase